MTVQTGRIWAWSSRKELWQYLVEQGIPGPGRQKITNLLKEALLTITTGLILPDEFEPIAGSDN